VGMSDLFGRLLNMVFTHSDKLEESFDCAICGKVVHLKVTGYEAQMYNFATGVEVCRVSEYTRNIHVRE
jgi:hypothetical protein